MQPRVCAGIRAATSDEGAKMDDLREKWLGQIAEAADEAAIEAVRVAAVGITSTPRTTLILRLAFKLRETCWPHQPSPTTATFNIPAFSRIFELLCRRSRRTDVSMTTLRQKPGTLGCAPNRGNIRYDGHDRRDL